MDYNRDKFHPNKLKKVLIIDGEPHVRIIVEACLKDLGGWQVIEAASLQEGLNKVGQEKLDAIVLDLMMPGIGRLNFLEQLYTHPVTRSTPIVILTERTYLIDLKQLSNLGVVGTISKPFNPVTLHKEIAKMLGWDEE